MAIESKITESLNKKIWIIPVLFGLMCYFFVSALIVLELKHFDSIKPEFAFSIGGELFAIMVSIVIVASILPAFKRQSGYIRIFVTLLAVGCTVCYLDIIQMVVDGLPEWAMFNRVIAIFIFANETAFVFFFWLYISYVLKVKGPIMNVMSTIASAMLVVFYLLPFVNFFAPLYFTIDDAGVYARNPSTWWICRIYIVLIVIFVVVSLFLSKEKKRTKAIIIIFMGIPLLSIGLGGFQYGISILYSSMMVSLVLIYALLFSDNEKHLYSTNKELGLATSIQQNMLPNIFPAFPDRKEFDVYAIMHPAKEVGGDFYDFFLIDETHLGLVIADVSDKGVPAALFMMASKIMVQNYAMMGFSPKEVLSKVNRQICSNNQEDMFVTVWLGILDLKTGILTASNGGHEKPIIKKPDGHFEVFEDKHNLVVGFFADAPYTEYQIHLEKGSKLFVYTDGIPECKHNHEQFGINRAVEALNKFENLSPEEISKNMLNETIKFMGSTDQFDDITMLCLEYRGYEDDINRIVIPAKTDEVPNAIKPITTFLKGIGAEHNVIYKVEVALEEILVNIASYAYEPGTGDIKIEYEYIEDSRMVSITIIDEGKAFDPLKRNDPDVTLSAEERDIGGLGLYIVKKTMDEVDYKRLNNRNVLILKKKI
ncbi:MAG: SpoIIE family protein phosphatase [Bacilli bacterium]|nr:SpoIIE family protein phosphatase [Bacilli bacterium]